MRRINVILGFLENFINDEVMSKKVTLGKEKILDSWSVLIERACGEREKIYSAVRKLIEESKIPEISIEPVIVTDQYKIRQEEYLMVSNKKLKDFHMYIGARDYGTDLNVSWYLTCEPGFFKSLLSSILEKSPYALSFTLDIFQQEELTAYVTKVHHCLLKAVENLMMNLGQDFSKVERKSRGFLGVS